MAFSTVALGYVLPGGAILRHLAKKFEELGLTSLRADGTVTLHGQALQEAAPALGLSPDKAEGQADATFFLRVPGRCRLDVSTSDASRLAAVDAAGKVRSEGAQVHALTTAVEGVCRLLANRGANELEVRGELDRYLRSLGVDTVVTSLERQGDQVVYALGKTGAAQFWVFKDSFLPARLTWTGADKTPWEVRFVDYNSPSAGELFPRIIEISQGGDKLLRFTVLKADSHALVPDKLFSATP
jgi:hypothetical protein